MIATFAPPFSQHEPKSTRSAFDRWLSVKSAHIHPPTPRPSTSRSERGVSYVHISHRLSSQIESWNHLLIGVKKTDKTYISPVQIAVFWQVQQEDQTLQMLGAASDSPRPCCYCLSLDHTCNSQVHNSVISPATPPTVGTQQHRVGARGCRLSVASCKTLWRKGRPSLRVRLSRRVLRVPLSQFAIVGRQGKNER